MAMRSDGGWFTQTLENYQEAARAGLRAQEQMTDYWQRMMFPVRSPLGWQRRAEEFADAAARAVKANIEDSMRIMNRTAQAGLDMLDQAFEAGQDAGQADARNRMRDLWELSLDAVRANSRAITQANAQMLDWWNGLVGQTVASAPEADDDAGRGRRGDQQSGGPQAEEDREPQPVRRGGRPRAAQAS